MRLLVIGDIVGRPGNRACAHVVPELIRDGSIDCVIANAENVAAGSGLTPQMFAKLRHHGIDACTMGDHIYRRREILPLLESSEHIVRPANLPSEAIGRTLLTVTAASGARVAIASLLGRMYMNVRPECPLHAIDRVLSEVPNDVKIIVVDVHAEATSEKIALGWYLDGRVTAVVGTHTHVQTADERILPEGTAYITDLGMTGPHDSVLGRRKERVIQHLLTGMPQQYTIADNDVRLCGVIIEADAETGRATHIERLCLSVPAEDASQEEN
jgi:metallophosphoesterase (TIGR00282 family)